MNAEQDIAAWLALSLISGLGDESTRKLLAAHGGPAEVLAASRANLTRIVKPQIAENIALGPDPAKLAAALKWLEDPANSIVTLADADYPKLLLNIADPPPLLYLKGRRDLLNSPALAVVGSRNATPQGLANAEQFAAALSAAGLCIVSGLALGIDAAAHRGGLRGMGGADGSTTGSISGKAASSIAVVGTGLDIVYPARNRELAHLLAKHGLIVSEFPLGTPALGNNFPRRNRIISGMSRGTLVVEAALKSGSLITAREALEQGRDVFAIPGSIHSPLSKGCHALIKQGAKLVESAQDILEDLGYAITHSAATENHDGNPDNDPDTAALLKYLGQETTDINTLSHNSGLSAEVVSAKLLQLEMEGRVASLPGGRYQRVQ